jgi:methyl-accepting chemotaxis protein
MIIGIISLCGISAVVLSGIIFYINNSNTDKLNENFKEYDIEAHKDKLENYIEMAYSTMEKNYNNATSKNGLINDYGEELTEIVEIAENIAKKEYALYEKGDKTTEEAMKDALNKIEEIKYDNGIGYVWINDTSSPYPKMVMHPISSELNGKTLSSKDYNKEVDTGNNIFTAAVEIAENEGSGFIYYKWPKEDKEEFKLSYVRHYKEWDWIIGTGVYVDDAIKNAKEETLKEIRKMSYDEGIGYFWINDTTDPIPKMAMHPISSELEGQVLDNEKYNVIGDNKKNLFKEFVDVTKKTGSGYVEYEWPKPSEDGSMEDVPKLSYVKSFEKWNWIVGTGVYLDDVEAGVKEQESTISENGLRSIVYIILTIVLIIGLAIVFVYKYLTKNIANPINDINFYLSEVARGNLKVNIEKSKKSDIYEFGLIKNHLISTVVELSNAITKINNEAVSVYQSSNETKNYIEELQSSLDNISTATEELSACMEETAASTEEMNVLTEDIGETTSNVVNTLNDKKFTIEENMNVFQNSTDGLIENLKHMVKGISEVSTANNQNAIGTTEISKSVTDILLQAQNVNKQSDKLKKTAFQLMESVGIFNT